MKPTPHLKSTVAHVKWILCGMLLAGGLGIGLTSQVARGQGNPNPGVIPSQARAYGLSYGEAPGGRPVPTPRPRPTPFPRLGTGPTS
jgi:hypothetical protein